MKRVMRRAGLVLCLLIGAASADETGLVVEGEGLVALRPDQAEFTVVVTSVEKTAQQATDQLTRQVTEVLKSLSKFDIKEKNVRRSELAINSHDTSIAKKVVPEGYAASMTLGFVLLNIGQAQELSASMAGLEGVRVQTPRYGRTDGESLRQEAVQKALLDARRKAEFAAKVLGVQIGRPTYVELNWAESRNGQVGVNQVLPIINADPFAEDLSFEDRVDDLDNVVFMSDVRVTFAIEK